MQRLDPPIHHLRKPVWVETSVTAIPASCSARKVPAGRQQLDILFAQRLGEGNQPGLVGDGEQRAGNLDRIDHGGDWL